MTPPPRTALVVDLFKPSADGTSQAVRQMVLTKASAETNRFIVLSRQITPSAVAKHWKRWPVEGSSISDDPASWLSEYLNMHRDRGFRLASIFAVELTEADWTEMTERDTTPRALMTRVDRSRESIGANVFRPEPRFASDEETTTTNMRATVQAAVNTWREDHPDAPEVAPAGRARAPRTPAAGAVSGAVTAQDPLDTVVPGTQLTLGDGTVYIARKIDGDLSDVEMLRRARENNAYALLYSVPGTGKTRASQAAFGDLIEMLGTADTEVTDFVGNYVPTGKPGEYRWIDGPLARAMDEGRPLLVDEIALIDPRTLSILYSAMDGRREINITMNPARGKIKAKDGFFVIGAFNPGAPGARVSEALLSRFLLQVEYSTDYDAMETLGVPRTFVVAAKNLETKRKNDEISVAPQARECLAYALAVELFGETVALRNVVASVPEQDRAVVADVLSRSFGRRIDALSTL